MVHFLNRKHGVPGRPCEGAARRQPGRRGDVPSGHRPPPGERRGLLVSPLHTTLKLPI